MKNAFSCALGLGLAGGIVGIHAYMLMSPHSQRGLKKSISKAKDELIDAVGDIGEELKNMR